jgi:hypothetical protein
MTVHPMSFGQTIIGQKAQTLMVNVVFKMESKGTVTASNVPIANINWQNAKWPKRVNRHIVVVRCLSASTCR